MWKPTSPSDKGPHDALGRILWPELLVLAEDVRSGTSLLATTNNELWRHRPKIRTQNPRIPLGAKETSKPHIIWETLDHSASALLPSLSYCKNSIEHSNTKKLALDVRLRRSNQDISFVPWVLNHWSHMHQPIDRIINHCHGIKPMTVPLNYIQLRSFFFLQLWFHF